jgi:UDPglucose--hexose-1-phosphate uridylyltransferase
VSELRRDPLDQRWIIVAPERSRRPRGALGLGTTPPEVVDPCPFCPGHEALTPPEILAIRDAGGHANGPGWHVRVFANQFPSLTVEGAHDKRAEGPYDAMRGVGAHEVIVETPSHEQDLADLELPALRDVVLAWRDRLVDLYHDTRLKYVLIFKNRGAAAGATIDHAHSQLIATPVNPIRISRKLDAFREHFKRKERCLFCDLLQHERRDGSRIVRDEGGFVTFAPYASRFPFELMIAPKEHRWSFGELSRHEADAMARAVKDALLRVRLGLGDPPYNFVIHAEPNLHAVPRRSGFWDTLRHDFHWQMIIYPRLTAVAGFEWGTGFYVNATPPEEAARHLRGVDIGDAAAKAWRDARGAVGAGHAHP